jgi:hypothetical protein
MIKQSGSGIWPQDQRSIFLRVIRALFTLWHSRQTGNRSRPHLLMQLFDSGARLQKKRLKNPPLKDSSVVKRFKKLFEVYSMNTSPYLFISLVFDSLLNTLRKLL